MKLLKRWLGSEKVRFWVQLLVGMIMFYFGMSVFSGIIEFVGGIPYGIEILFIIGGVLIGKWFFQVAYELQDEAWYRKRFIKTGDDFEGRYCLENNCKHGVQNSSAVGKSSGNI